MVMQRMVWIVLAVVVALYLVSIGTAAAAHPNVPCVVLHDCDGPHVCATLPDSPSCGRCSGTGKCWNCTGSGRTTGDQACYMCIGTGKCHYCAGTGHS